MKKLLLSMSAFCCVLVASGQDLISKIPANASAVVTIKGKRMTDLVSVKDFSNSKLGQMLNKQLARESKEKVMNLEDLGIDLQRNFYYFLEVNDGVFNNCFLIPLKNPKGFLNMLSESEKERIVTENRISYFQDDYDGTVTLWNENTLLLILAKDQKLDYSYYDDFYESPSIAIEEAQVAEVEEAPIEAIAPVEVAEEVVEEAVEIEEEVIEEVVIEAAEVEEAIEDPYYNDYYNSEEYKQQEAAREKRRKEQDAKRAARRKELVETTLTKAKRIMAGNYSQGTILKNPNYLKSIGTGKEEASAWVDDFGQIYKEALPANLYGGMMNPYSFMDIDRIYGGISASAKLDFAEDHVAINTVYSMSDEMARIYKPMYEGKFNSNFTKYVNEDRLLGYMSLNMSTEGMLKAYPDLIDTVFKDTGDQSYGDAVALGTHLFSLLIDEEGAAEIVRGDMLLLLNDLQEREVTYTDYEYDEDYNYKKVEKTKMEAIPDFLFMFSSEQKPLFDRLIRIGVKEKELTAINGMHQITGLGKSSPFDLYVMFKDNTVFLGSSKNDMMAINRGTFVPKLSSELRRNIKKNVTSLYANGGKIVSEIPVDSYPRDLRDKVQMLTSSTGDVHLNFEKIKGNTMKGKMIWSTPGEGSRNSFEYFLNMIDSLMD